MSKNQKVAKYLREVGDSKDWSSEYLYLMSKTLGFQLWDLKQAWKELKRAFLNILK
jgi:hypothetical protein